MLNQFQNTLSLHFPFLKKAKCLVAVSGGMDSMVLLHLMQQLQLNIAVVHCNFKLRGEESDGDEDFVMNYCKLHSIPFFCQRFDTQQFASDHKLSIQVAARQLRYNWFFEVLEVQKFHFVATAHHLDDQLETWMINFLRGTGLNGLTGIPLQNDTVLRPLLSFSRNQIEAHAQDHGVLWRDDSSNASDNYLRNKIRHHVIPTLKELNPNLLTTFEKTIANLDQAQSMVEDASSIVYRKVVKELDNQKIIDLKALMELPNYTAYLYQWLAPFGFSAWADIAEVVTAQSGKQIFSDKHRLLKDRETLILAIKLEPKQEEFWIPDHQTTLQFPIPIAFSSVSELGFADSKTIFVDSDSLKFPLKLRKWRAGDYFYPFGMEGKKKVSKFFKDEKISLHDKEKMWLLCSEDQPIWIVGKRMDNRFKVTENTRTIVKIALL